MRLKISSVLRIAILLSPALFILILTVIISLLTGHPKGLFLSRSIRGILVRFVLVTLIFILPTLILPNLLALTVKMAKNEGPFGQFAMTTDPYKQLSKPDAWIIRPLQGIGLSMIFAERLQNILEDGSKTRGSGKEIQKYCRITRFN